LVTTVNRREVDMSVASKFQQWVKEGWTRRGDPKFDLAVMALGLAGETGEVIEPIKKEIRGDGPLNRAELVLELGDVLHYLCAIASHYDIGIENIMFANVSKIEAKRGKRAWEAKEPV
jgi:NTP pyrophosphatase (non-canonical NTP hydrolase)